MIPGRPQQTKPKKYEIFYFSRCRISHTFGSKHEEIVNILAKLNDYNYKVIASMAKTILELQTARKPGKKG